MVKLIICTFLFFSNLVFSKTLIISDIDDTLKIAHVKDIPDAIAHAYQTRSYFKAMAPFLRLLLQDIKNSKLVYLTNANEKLFSKSHTSLLKNGRFPPGKIFFKKDLSDPNHKRRTLELLIRSFKPTNIILLGDNGENDLIYYNEVYEKYNNRINIYQYIRTIYNKKDTKNLFAEQVPFISPVNIALDLMRKNLVKKEQMSYFIKQVAYRSINEKTKIKFRPMFFPNWIDCSLHKWNFKTSIKHLHKALKSLDSFYKKLCFSPSYQ